MTEKTEHQKKKKPGRPKKYTDSKARVRAFRNRKKHEGHRLDVFIETKANWRLTKLAEAWNCSSGKVIERLLLEADERYEEILFPDTE